MIKRYDDFEVVITKKNKHLYADLGATPDGRHLSQPVSITMPDDLVAWAEARQGHKSEAELAELGHRLFQALITGQVASEWNACLSKVRRRPNTGLRLRFNIQADVLTQAPLELLCARTAPLYEFLTLDALTPVVRSPRYGGFVHERPITLPLRVLVVIADSGPQVATDPVAERASLEGALADLTQLTIDYLGLPGGANADYDTLYRTLIQTKYPYDVVRFIGHSGLPDTGDTENILSLTSPGTESNQDTRISDLASLLTYTGVRIVILQAGEEARDDIHHAFQDVAKRFIAKGLPTVMTMQCPVSQDVATRFYRQFYNSWLAESDLLIEDAVAAARQSVYRQFNDRTSSWWSPVLFVHPQNTRALRVKVDRQPFRIQLKRGRILMQRGQIDQAVAELERAYAAAPDRICFPLARALAAQAQALEESGDENGALAACERALEVFPVEQMAQEIRVSIWTRRGDKALAQDDLHGALVSYQQAGDRPKIDEVEAKKRQRQDALEKSVREANEDLSTITLDTTIAQHYLKAGEEYIQASEWQAAVMEFNLGLELYRQFGDPDELPGRSGEQFRDLRMGQLYAQGALCLSEQRWQAAAGTFDVLCQFGSTYQGIDVVSQLEQAQLEQRCEQRYHHLLALMEQEDWIEISRLTADLDPNYTGPDGGSVGAILRHALYAWGKELETDDPWRAYYLFYSLYQQAPDYEDVAELCAAVAFKNGMRQDVPSSWEQRVDWLEKVIEIDPDHRTGHTQRLLDKARHRWAEELLGENNLAGAAQLERIGPDYDQWVEVRQTLAGIYYRLLQEGRYHSTERSNLDAEAEARSRLGIEQWEKGNWQGAVEQLGKIPPEARVFPSMLALAQTYVALGHRERKAGQWRNAIEWWDKALIMSPGLVDTLGWRIREAKLQLWARRHKREVGIIGAVFIVLAVVITILRIHSTPAISLPSETLTPTLTSTVTPSAPLVSEPSSTATFAPIPTPTSTFMPMLATDVPVLVSTSTPTPTLTATPTPAPATPTLFPTPTAASPHLQKPASGEEVRNSVTFEWAGSLRGGQTFHVILRHVTTGATFESPDLTTRTWTTDLPGDRYGAYYWQVVIVQGGAIVARSDEEWHFWFVPFDPSGGQLSPTEPPPEGPPPTEPS